MCTPPLQYVNPLKLSGNALIQGNIAQGTDTGTADPVFSHYRGAGPSGTLLPFREITSLNLYSHLPARSPDTLYTGDLCPQDPPHRHCTLSLLLYAESGSSRPAGGSNRPR